MKTLLIAMLLMASAEAPAVTIDTDTFFAYRDVPQLGFVALLSKNQCQGKGWGKGWKKAEFNYANRGYSMPACWHPFDDDHANINLCAIVKENGSRGACIPASKSGFIDTSTLPTGARF